ncbi:MAG: hypothetical protein AAGE59_24190 [Cyanobacteria bacterium P01_F01_bin.86]
MRIHALAILTAAMPIVCAAQPAAAVNFIYDSQAVGGNVNVGIHESIRTTFNPQTDLLTWSSTFATNPNNGKLADGAWLVLSEGPNPKSNQQQYTMFYMDGVNEKLTAYTYNGVNGSNSWQDSNSVFLGSWELGVEENTAGDKRTFSFAMDMTDINNRTDLGSDWEGTYFKDKVGIWFHGVADVNATYNDDGSLSEFSYSSQGWYDTKDRPTQAVPEPGMLAGIAAVTALGVVQRKRMLTDDRD